ncbi:MAG: YybH family protein [Casimicrobium sp.]
MSSQVSFPTPDDCARAFYQAIARAEVEAVMATCAEDEDICCAHPGAAPLYGFAAVRAAWDAIFRNNSAMRIELSDEHWNHTIGMAVQHAIEWIYAGDEPKPRGSVFVTNVFLRSPLGWRMLSHVASPVQSALPTGGQQVVLH